MCEGGGSYRYKADGPITDARKAETTPEPLPTSRHTLGLEKRIQTEISLFKVSCCRGGESIPYSIL